MTPLFAAARELLEFVESQGWRFCIIGGLALLRWGEPRFTRDVDLTLLTGFGSEDEFILPLIHRFKPRIPDAPDFARRNRVLLLEAGNRIPIDIALGALPFEQSMVERSSEFEFEPGCLLRICSAEDLIVQKLFAYRARDIADVEGVALRMAGQLDWSYIETHLAPLAELKGDPAITAALARLRNQSPS